MKFILTFSVVYFASGIFPQSILLHERDATVWGREQNISGRLNNFFAAGITLNLNGNSTISSVNPSDSSFSFQVILNEGLSRIIVSADTINSDTLKLMLGYNIQPDIYAYTTVIGRNVNLHASVIDNPDTSLLTFLWSQDISNPSSLTISNENDSLASVTFLFTG